MRGALRKILLVIVVLVLLALTVPGYHYYQYLESHVSTDDAYVDGTVALVSSRIPGTVAHLYVEENWAVRLAMCSSRSTRATTRYGGD